METRSPASSAIHPDSYNHSAPTPASGPIIIIETPRYLPHATTSPRAQALETRRCALDIAYLHRLSAWDDETYERHWAQWEDKVYRARLAALRVQMRRCIAPGSAGELRMEDKVKENRKGRARLGRWRAMVPRGDRQAARLGVDAC
jgi:hypothetical protein